MGSRYYEECEQINSLIELYEEYEQTKTQKERDESIQRILFLIRDIKLWEEY